MNQQYFNSQAHLLTDEAVDIWLIDRSLHDWPDSSTMGRCLTYDEKQRWQRYYFAQDRDYFLKTRYAAKRILANYLECEASSIVWYLGEQEKPYLINSHYQFNLSHSGQYALLAVGYQHPLGIDIESINALTNCLEIAQRFFSVEEINQLERLAETPQQLKDAFFKIWTAKESLIKALGTGLSLSLTAFAVDVSNTLSLIRLDQGNQNQWQLHQLAIAPGYQAALACNPCVKTLRRYPFYYSEFMRL